MYVIRSMYYVEVPIYKYLEPAATCISVQEYYHYIVIRCKLMQQKNGRRI